MVRKYSIFKYSFVYEKVSVDEGPGIIAALAFKG
jgi:hypothetical protein